MGVKISALPPIVTPALTDVFPVVQGGVTYKESGTQFASLFVSLASLPLAVNLGGTGQTLSTGTGAVVLKTAPTITGPFIDSIYGQSNGNLILNLVDSVNAVNRLNILNSPTGSPLGLQFGGSDTNVNVSLTAKGTGTFTFSNNGGGGTDNILLLAGANTAVNYLSITSALTTASPVIAAVGSDTNITLTLNGKGTGGVTLLGTSTNDSAAAGYVGQIIETTVLAGAAVALTTATAADVASVALTAGDWDVWGNIVTAPAAGTTTSALDGWISSTSATKPTKPNAGAYASILGITVAANGILTLPVGMRRISVAAPTTVYLGIECAFAVSTMGAYGYIGARRVR